MIADEPTTALDVTIQAQIVELLKELKDKLGMAIIFITYDLGVVSEICDKIIVMYAGKVVEEGMSRQIFYERCHPYTEGLMVSIPRLDTPAGIQLEAIPGSVPHPLDLPKGCKFAPRCKYATERCRQEEPQLVNVTEDQQIRCFYPEKEERHGK